MMRPLVSIITPTYNQGKFIEATIRSVLQQKYENLEFIVMDGGSTDETIEILRKYSDRITVWRSEPDNGQSDAINKGYRMSHGTYVNWLNSDDILLDGALESMVDYLERHKEIDVVYGNTIMIDENGTEIVRRHEIGYDNRITLYALNYLPQPSALIRRSALDPARFVDERLHFCMDHELWIRLHANGKKFAHLRSFLSLYRAHTQSKGFSDQWQKMNEERRQLKRSYGLSIHWPVGEKAVYGFLSLVYRMKRKWLQIVTNGTTNILPFTFRLKIHDRLS